MSGEELKLPQYEGLDIQHLQRLFDNMSECYKLFWFQALIELSQEGDGVLTYEQLIHRMIANAWYMVSEYKLNLGPADTLEALVRRANEISGLKSGETPEKIIETIDSLKDPILKKQMQTLTLNVPYRLLAPFLPYRATNWGMGNAALAEYLNQEAKLIYTFEKIAGLNSVIRIKPEWLRYIRENYGILLGWTRYNMIEYLQRRNPNVPGLSSKLSPPQERDLAKVQGLWKKLANVMEVRDIYGGLVLTSKDLSIDHFVPWSYVTHDELWNLSPTTKSINSQKSNRLPEWDIYFERLSALEYQAYRAVWEHDEIRKAYDACLKENVNSEEVKTKLFLRQNLTPQEYAGRLEEILLPVYNAARNQGFDEWTYTA